MIRTSLAVVLLCCSLASARLVPRRVCRPQCLGAMAASTRPYPYGSDMSACFKHDTGPPTPRCLHILVRRCMHHKPDCEFTPLPPPSPSGTFLP